MRADRLLSILLLLQRRQKMAAADLAEQLEVSVRTIYRDIEALSAAGVPVYAEQGRNGGISLVPGYRTDLTGLTAGEAQALFVFSGKGSVEQFGLGDDLRQAIRKLLASVPDAQRAEVERISGRIVVDPNSWRRGDDVVPHLSALQDAVIDDRRVRIGYPSPSAGRPRAYDIEPYGLVAKAGVWYLLANTDRGLRTFRVGRILSMAVFPDRFERPEGLDVEALWKESSRAFTKSAEEQAFDVLVRIQLAGSTLVRRTAGDLLRTGPDLPGGFDDDRRNVATMRFNSMRHAVAFLAQYGALVEVVEPAVVRDELVAHARGMLEVYGSPPADGPSSSGQ